MTTRLGLVAIDMLQSLIRDHDTALAGCGLSVAIARGADLPCPITPSRRSELVEFGRAYAHELAEAGEDITAGDMARAWELIGQQQESMGAAAWATVTADPPVPSQG